MTNDLCLWDETSIKTPEHQGSEKFPVGEQSEVLADSIAPSRIPPTHLFPRAAPES